MAEEFPYAGTVSAGTLRPEDLVPAFTNALGAMLEDARIEPESEDQRQHCLQLVRAARHAESQGIEHYAGTAYLSGLTDRLQEALNELAPEGYYFGALEGDGADFGFWRAEGEQDYVATIAVRFTADNPQHAGERAGAMAASIEENFGVAEARADVDDVEDN